MSNPSSRTGCSTASTVLDIGGTEVRLIDAGAAHSAGDTIVHVPDARTVYTGDIVFVGATPLVWHGPFADGLAACDLLLGLDVDTVVPGHGPVTTKEAVRTVRDYLSYVHEEATARFTAGMPAVDAARDIRLGPFAGLEESERLAVNVYTVYRELDPALPPLDGPELFGRMAGLACPPRFARPEPLPEPPDIPRPAAEPPRRRHGLQPRLPPTRRAHPSTPPARHTGTIIAGCLAVCLAQIGLVLPAAINGVIQRSLETSGAELTWISDAFLVPAAVLALTFGVVGDLYGRKKLLVGGALLAAVGYLVSATSDSAAQLITGQALSGIGAAALFPASLAVIIAGTPTPAARARGLASWTTALSMGAFIAPLLSGAVVEHTSFHWAFAATGVLALVTAAAAWRLTAESSAPEGRSLDWPGQITIAVALLALLYGIIQGPTDGWGSADGRRLLRRRRGDARRRSSRPSRAATSPMLRLELFRNPAFAASAAMAVIGMFGFLGGAYDLSIRLGVIQHQSPLRAAVPFLIIQARHPAHLAAAGPPAAAGGPGPDAGHRLRLAGRRPAVAACRAGARDRHARPAGAAGPQRRRLRTRRRRHHRRRRQRRTAPSHRHGRRDHQPGPRPRPDPRPGDRRRRRPRRGHQPADRQPRRAALTPAEHGTATAVLDAGGPLALHTADLGPLSAKLAPLTERALADGYDDVLLLTAGRLRDRRGDRRRLPGRQAAAPPRPPSRRGAGHEVRDLPARRPTAVGSRDRTTRSTPSKSPPNSWSSSRRERTPAHRRPRTP